ncbi:MAG: aminotransferase class V-fold PLP-dependent enzyme [Phycisphaerales bacterium]|nr:aminotransferase class V-fold PLP-dependent enzyme [Phycisphaerales bacterium]
MPAPSLTLPQPDPIIDQFVIDRDIVYLNHGSFGACPRAILDAQTAHRLQAERELVRFYVHDSWEKIDRSRNALAALVECQQRDLVFVHNATTGVATVLKNLDLNAGDELLVTDCEYQACLNNFQKTAEKHGASIKRVTMPWPIESEDHVIDAVMAGVTSKTKIALLSLITSSTGIRFPIEKLIPRLKEQGVETLLDAAHGPGCVPMDINAWGAAYTTGNAHKWLCAPKGAAFLHVREDLQDEFEPLVISNDAMQLETASEKSGRTPFNHAFDYAGTDDVSMYLTIADSIEWLSTAHPDGIEGVMERNRAVCLRARDLIRETIGVTPPVPDSMLGPLSTINLPVSSMTGQDLKRALLEDYRIQVPVWGTPSGSVAIRISVQVYNSIEQYEYLASALKEILSAS